MIEKVRFPVLRRILITALPALLLASCGVPFQWNADIKKFVDDGQSILKLDGFTAENGGSAKTVIPSGKETIVSLDIVNPREIALACAVLCADESLFDSLPAVTIPDSTKIEFAFTPSVAAERKDLVFTVALSSPEIEKEYPSEPIVIHCNTPPLGVEPSLDAALDGGGRAFAAFRLPSSPTDDDLSQVRITFARAESIDLKETVVFSVDEACLCSRMIPVSGIDLLGAADPLNRYYQPASLASGENYVFGVTLIDSEGLESEIAEITTDAARYAVTYDGNGNTEGSAPMDPRTYRHTKSVTVLGAGTLTRSDYTFALWNDEADGSGKAYAPGSVFKMGPRDLRLYAKWVQEESVVVAFTMNPAYGSINFPVQTVIRARGQALTLTTSTIDAVDWHWYVDNDEVGQTAGSFTWNIPSDKPPGQYIINVDALYQGRACTGSIRVTVTY